MAVIAGSLSIVSQAAPCGVFWQIEYHSRSFRVSLRTARYARQESASRR